MEKSEFLNYLPKIHAYLKKQGWTPTADLQKALNIPGDLEAFRRGMSEHNGGGLNVKFKPFVSTKRANNQTGYECHPRFNPDWTAYKIAIARPIRIPA